MKTATTIKIIKVELLDDKGKLLEVLASCAPKLWTAGNAAKYALWDEKLGGGQTVQAMYDLAMPHWDNIVQGGRWQAHTKVFQLRVSITIGAGNKTSVSKQSITPVRLPPPVPT